MERMSRMLHCRDADQTNCRISYPSQVFTKAGIMAKRIDNQVYAPMLAGDTR